MPGSAKDLARAGPNAASTASRWHGPVQVSFGSGSGDVQEIRQAGQWMSSGFTRTCKRIFERLEGLDRCLDYALQMPPALDVPPSGAADRSPRLCWPLGALQLRVLPRRPQRLA